MTETLLYAGGVLLFALGVAVSIGLHELGHFLPGKAFGVRITQFFIGFGRNVWSKQRGETEYGLKLIPLGGYVKLVGMLPPGPDQAEGTVRETDTGMFTRLVADARSAEYEIVRPGEEHRLFYRLPWWKKVIVMAGGPTVNLVLAFAAFGALFMIHGIPEATLKLDVVYDCVIPADEPDRECAAGDPLSPAAAAGLRAGDEIVAMNGEKVSTWEEFSNLIRDNGENVAVIDFVRDGEAMTTETSTVVTLRPENTDPESTEDLVLVERGFLGVSPREELVEQGPGYVVATMGDYTVRTVEGLAAMPQKLYHVGRVALGLEERSIDSPMSVIGASRVAGEVASNEQVPLSDRLFGLLGLLGAINLFVGMFNFVPLLPLDGGHIAGALYEGVRRGFARLFRRPDPGYFDVAKLIPVAYAMASVILVMSVLLIYVDIVAPVDLG
jgi:membrane-associated protease RseP (regulator of RpoE activity)